jgi:CarboxypepD_reg-like domain
MYRALLLLFLVFVLANLFCVAQPEKRTVSGIVVDSLTKEPLPFVNVFLANTTRGASTAANGSFSIQSMPPGKYDLVASYVRYKPYMIAVDFTAKENGFIKEIKLSIELVQEAKQLQEIVIKEDTTNRAKLLADFKRVFLGQTRNSKECKILNPRDIHLYFDARERLLLAHAKKPIEVENRALGYKIYFYLNQFEVNYQKGSQLSYGVYRFEELTSEKARKNKTWERERRQAYLGSVTHFMRALRDSALKQNAFTVRKIFTVPNLKRPSDEFINKKISALRKEHNSNTIIISDNPKDSLRYYLRLKAEPKEIDSLGNNIYSGGEFVRPSPEKIEGIKGRYQVIYIKNEEIEYLLYINRKYAKKQTSVFHFSENSLTIYANGHYENVFSLFTEGYLSWRENMSNNLPLEYVPPLK